MSAALAAAVASSVGGVANAGQYLSGDFHNHTTCSDGSTSVKTLTRKSLSYLDWFIQVGHSGSGARDCRVSDFLYLNRDSSHNRGLWVNTIGKDDRTRTPSADDKGREFDIVDSATIKGDATSYRKTRDGDQVRRMWRWQSLQEFALPSIVEERELPENKEKVAFLGMEWTVPGHEHSSNSISRGQYGEVPNADALAQFEYCFGRPSNDTSQGGGQGWTCEISEANNERLKELFNGRPEEGTADYNSTLKNGVNIDDNGEHVKSAAAILWMQENFPEESMAVQAHVERQGAFVSGSNRGYNIEHMRDWNTLAPEIAFGFETQPGHQAVRDRGSYAARRPTVGLYTYGGTGCYGAAEAAQPGYDFEGKALKPEDFGENGRFNLVRAGTNPARVTLCRPGVRTAWDALLSEGRKFWFFASSDWHSRGSFGPMDYESTVDFYPGEYQENFTYFEDADIAKTADPAKTVIAGLRSGNNYTVQGQLIANDLKFTACTFRGECATMGETLDVRRGMPIRVTLEVTDPEGTNNSVYAFNNPSLLQIGKEVPLNQPELTQVDLIAGVVTGIIPVANPEYNTQMAPATTRIVKTFDSLETTGNSRKVMTYVFRATQDSYIRARGSNIPAGTPNERDAQGNPLSDHLSNNIPCDDAACPAHINAYLDADVEAWADVWFHTNPIFIEVKDGKNKL